MIWISRARQCPRCGFQLGVRRCRVSPASPLRRAGYTLRRSFASGLRGGLSTIAQHSACHRRAQYVAGTLGVLLRLGMCLGTYFCGPFRHEPPAARHSQNHTRLHEGAQPRRCAGAAKYQTEEAKSRLGGHSETQQRTAHGCASQTTGSIKRWTGTTEESVHFKMSPECRSL